jgi:hypothetical protein
MTDANGPSDDPTSSTSSAGESGAAASAPEPAAGPEEADVVIGEIPDAEDLSRMLWTARCTIHDLLGTYPTRETAEEAGARHLSDEHASA